jgi:hypothetical protein
VTLLICGSNYVLGQKPDKPDDLLQPPSGPLNSCFLFRFVDDAVLRAGLAKAKLFVIFRAKGARDVGRAAANAKYISNYYRGKKIEGIVTAVDMNADRSDLLDLYLNGEFLYSLRIKKREIIDWLHC